MKYAVRIMPEAYDALASNASWWADNRSRDQAMLWYDGFIAKLETLADMPLSHPIANENDVFSFELKELHFGLGSGTTHRALFRIVGTTVEVLTIRHAAQSDLASGDLP